jgi:hypothetical protein
LVELFSVSGQPLSHQPSHLAAQYRHSPTYEISGLRNEKVNEFKKRINVFEALAEFLLAGN